MLSEFMIDKNLPFFFYLDFASFQIERKKNKKQIGPKSKDPRCH